MKKILIFSFAYLPSVGGAELAVREITERISDFQFDMITRNFGYKNFERLGNINVYRVNCLKLFFPFVAFFKAYRLNKKNKYDAIWSIMANRAGFAALFFKLFYPKIPFLLTLQEGDDLDYPKKRMGIFWPFLKPLFRMIFKKADKIQAISNYLKKWAEDMGAKSNIEIVPNGVDLEKFQISDSEVSSYFRSQIGFKSPDDKLLVTASRLVKKNAVKDIIEALKFLPENIKLLILGDGPERDNLKSKIKNLKLDNRVVFLGHIDHKDLPYYLKISDVFVRPSLTEGLGTAFLEAMAVGIPIIATPVGGIPDFLRDRETGLFCNVNDPQSIAEKVKILLEDEKLRNKIINQAKDMVSLEYNWNNIAKKMKSIFEEILGQNI